jgi:tetratricopeptide (TPR) repeat protein/3',5'-cyclic AMP phosphodiesterase CpdA
MAVGAAAKLRHEFTRSSGILDRSSSEIGRRPNPAPAWSQLGRSPVEHGLLSPLVSRGRIFVVMPFGVKPSTPNGEEHDFDDFYNQILRPVARAEGWEVLRIDELVEPGAINHQAIRELYAADLVVADLSLPNGNVYYELGVRQAISPGGTLLIALEGASLPFDLVTQRVLFYSKDPARRHTFVENYRAVLRLPPATHSDNPVKTAFESLGLFPDPVADAASIEREFEAKIARAKNAEQLVAVWHWAKEYRPLPVGTLLALAQRLADVSDYETALRVLTSVPGQAAKDYELHRQRGFYLRHLEQFEAAQAEFRRALELNPGDPETLGMLGGLYKRLRHYPEALECYKRGALLAPALLYMRVNQAAMAILTSPGDVTRGIELYRSLKEDIDNRPQAVGDGWAALVRAEANFALGRFDEARKDVAKAVSVGARPLDLRSAADQISLLGEFGFRSVEADVLATHLRDEPGMGLAVIGEQSPAEPSFSPRLIIHISDVHFGSWLKEGQIVDVHRFHDSENSSPLSAELSREIARALLNTQYGPKDLLLVISGDLTFTGKSQEFKLLERFLVELCEAVPLKRDQVVLVPGNHDVDWQLAGIDLSHRFDHYLSFARRFYGPDLFSQLFPLVDWDFQVETARPRPSEIVLIKRHDVATLVGLNSCVFETHQDHYGFVGLRQLAHVEDLLGTASNNGIRIAVMHHHLHPYPESVDLQDRGTAAFVDSSTVRDAGLVEQRLERLGFDLILHGHKHKPQLRETRVRDRLDADRDAAKTLIISGAGSVGVSSSYLEQSEGNHYALIEPLRAARQKGAEFVRVEWRELSYLAGATWSTTKHWRL